jgi:Xaa-Pro dipeptidase
MVDPKRVMQLNAKRLQDLMTREEIDALLVSRLDNFRYLTGYKPCVTLFYLHRYLAMKITGVETPIIFPRTIDVQDVKADYPWFEDVRGLPLDQTVWIEVVEKTLSDYDMTKARIAADPHTPWTLIEGLRTRLPETSFVNARPILETARMIKNEEEIKTLRKAGRIADASMLAALEAIRDGVTEKEVASAASNAVSTQGGEMPVGSFMVASGRNAIISKELATDKVIEEGDFVIIDGGAFYDGYCVEFARTKFVGKPSQEQKQIYKTVLKSERDAIAAIRHGERSSKIDRISREAIRSAGFGAFEHKAVTGHGTGLSTHEQPLIGDPGSPLDIVLEKGMVIAIEPGIYKPEVGATRIEDVVVVTDGKPEFLTNTKLEANLLD